MNEALLNATYNEFMIILYADDDNEDQEVFAEIILRINPEIKILRAKNGLKAIEILSGNEMPDLIFLDLNMPLLNGYQALHQIRKNDKFKNTDVIICSTSGYRKTFDEYAYLNARCLRKPNTISEGIESISAIIETKNTNISLT